MDKNLTLNQDTQTYGYVQHSAVSKPEFVNGREIYSIDIEPEDPSDFYSIGLLYDAYMGPECVNREETVDQLMNAKVLRFESIQKPLTTGNDPTTGEFPAGSKVRVSVRFELRNGEMNHEGTGEFKFPVFQLRFVDAECSTEPAETITKPDPETLVYYDF